MLLISRLNCDSMGAEDEDEDDVDDYGSETSGNGNLENSSVEESRPVDINTYKGDQSGGNSLHKSNDDSQQQGTGSYPNYEETNDDNNNLNTNNNNNNQIFAGNDETDTDSEMGDDNMESDEFVRESDNIPPQPNQPNNDISNGLNPQSPVLTYQNSRQKLMNIIKKPGILAGIVGGAIIGILTAILLIMFIVYRMRKKDEGSYALEETKKPLNAYDYRHCPTKEFYA